jgi:hypothetical protein
VTRPTALSPGVYLDAHSCVLLSRLLAPIVRQIGSSSQLAEALPALEAIALAAERERVAEAARLRSGPRLGDGWMPTAEYARLKGVSPQAIRKQILRGTLCAARRGRGWVVDPSSP